MNIPKDHIMEGIVSTFRTYGYEGASLSKLSTVTGLGRSSLYHYFPDGKVDMARAAFIHLTTQFESQVLNPLADTQLTPNERLDYCKQGLQRFYAEGYQPCLLNIFSMGQASEALRFPIREFTLKVKHSLAVFMIGIGLAESEAERRSEALLIELQGTLVLTRALNDSAVFQRFLDKLPTQLLG